MNTAVACFSHLALPVGQLRDAAPKLLRYRRPDDQEDLTGAWNRHDSRTLNSAREQDNMIKKPEP